MERIAGEQQRKRRLSPEELWRQRIERWSKVLELVRSWCSDLARKLEDRGVRVDSIILFGSYARGDYSESSDLDLIVVSEDWSRMSYTERLSTLYKLWDKPVDGNFIPLTPRELEELQEKSVVIRDASRYWITVYSRQQHTS